MREASQLARPGVSFFVRRGAPAPATRPAAGPGDEANTGGRLLCARCRHPVTHRDERIEVNGAHGHRCTNPGGHTFDIGCFREAAGCAAIGDATRAHTWFKGYAWRIAVCASCEHHLGWRFESPADHFHGLILDRLTSAAGGDGS